MMLHTSHDPCHYFGSTACEPAGAETLSGPSRARNLTQSAPKVAKSVTPQAPGTPLGGAKSEQKYEKYGFLRVPPKLQNGHQKSKLRPKDAFSEPQEAAMRPQTVAASAWPKRKAALCGYSFAPERAQNAPKPGSDTAGVPLGPAQC